MLTICLAVSMLFISDRDNFWDNEEVSKETQLAQVDEQGITELLTDVESADAWESVKGKKILLLVHGFENPIPFGFYHDVRVNIEHLAPDCNYDQVIGYVWPSFDLSYQYFSARNFISNGIADRFNNHLIRLLENAASVDILAHSMGNRVVLEALSKKNSYSQLVRNFFLFAPAVNDDSIYPNKAYFDSTSQCDNIYIFHSKNDTVLKWWYLIPERTEALGYEGDINPDQLPKHVQMIDCSSVIDTHAAYLFCMPIYKYIDEIAKTPLLTPYYAQDVVLLGNGIYHVIRWRHKLK